jgi:hypothetical protein
MSGWGEIKTYVIASLSWIKIRFLYAFYRAIMWSSLVKIQYTELKLSCGNDPVVKFSIYSRDGNDYSVNRLTVGKIATG